MMEWYVTAALSNDTKADTGKPGLPLLSPDYNEEHPPAAADDAILTQGYSMMPMVGLGGSAGSLAPLQAFFKVVPPDSGMAFVVVLHLSPEHESAMPQILQHTTKMKVLQAVDGVEVRPNTVYVIPPAKHLTLADGHLKLTDLEPERGRRIAVDLFFRSLADTHGPHAIAIVLSGADGDGTIGLKRIKERGGLTIAQDPTEAEVPSMPQSAIHTGMVDWVLRAGDMPGWLLKYQSNEKRVKVPSAEEAPPEKPDTSQAKSEEATLLDVLAFLRARTGRDFICYKRATIVRRISRRMQINAVDDLAGYLDFLRVHPGESGALLQDLLISVTNFFRDREVFDALEKLMPQIFKGKGPGDAVRIWTPACATGEEAYSMAMMAIEHASTLEAPPDVQIFGCDLDENAIKVARAGLYPAAITADVSEDRLRRFFVKDHRGYQIRREVREVVLFATHDLLKDAPFSRMDLISCRNLLIYLKREAQERVLNTFHFALRPGGLLCLGTTESVDEDSKLFAVVDKKHRLYAHQQGQRTGQAVPSGSSTLLRTLDAHRNTQIDGPVLPERSFNQEFDSLTALVARNEGHMSVSDLHFRLVERLAPPSILVDKEYSILHISESAGRFLQIASGALTTSLLTLIHPALRDDLRSALHRASETGVSVTVPGIAVDLDRGTHEVDLRVSPDPDPTVACLLVSFEIHDILPTDAAPRLLREEPEPAIRRLEREAEALKSRLRDTIEQFEGSCEELKASNEELQAMNEELRSAGEELETSREELQSINEELSTVNQELKSNLDELSLANSDMHNLMASTSIPTLFLDRHFCIKRYTPSAVGLFHLIPGDIGRPLADLRHQLDYPGLHADAERVLSELTHIEREVCDTTPEGRCYLARLLPYRTVDDHIGGVVLTLVDVTEARRAAQALATELADTQQLQKVSGQLIHEGNIDLLYHQILDAAAAVMRSDMASLQIFYPEKNALRLLASKGFHPQAAEYWEWVSMTSRLAAGMSMNPGDRVIIPDVETCVHAAGAEDLQYYRLSNIRALQSTPLLSRSGSLVGMISTQWSQTHWPSERELRLFDVLARQAADLIERKRAEDLALAHQERQIFLLKLSDQLQGASDAAHIEQIAASMLGEMLRVDGVFVAHIDVESDLADVPQEWTSNGLCRAAGQHKFSSFGVELLTALKAGQTMAVADLQGAAPAPLSARARICIPLIWRGMLTSIFCITTARRASGLRKNFSRSKQRRNEHGRRWDVPGPKTRCASLRRNTALCSPRSKREC